MDKFFYVITVVLMLMASYTLGRLNGNMEAMDMVNEIIGGVEYGR